MLMILVQPLVEQALEPVVVGAADLRGKLAKGKLSRIDSIRAAPNFGRAFSNLSGPDRTTLIVDAIGNIDAVRHQNVFVEEPKCLRLSRSQNIKSRLQRPPDEPFVPATTPVCPSLGRRFEDDEPVARIKKLVDRRVAATIIGDGAPTKSMLV
ncbi:MAG: hypothetical protein WD757_00565 [Actinomycetota bacterium]